jgi:pimeloyl-ACP methyl ester carboxylesterase
MSESLAVFESNIQSISPKQPRNDNKCFSIASIWFWCILTNTFLLLASIVYIMYNIIKSYTEEGVIRYDTILALWSGVFSFIFSLFFLLVLIFTNSLTCCASKKGKVVHIVFVIFTVSLVYFVNLIAIFCYVTTGHFEVLILFVVQLLSVMCLVYLVLKFHQEYSVKNIRSDYLIIMDDDSNPQPKRFKNVCIIITWILFLSMLYIFLFFNIIFSLQSFLFSVENIMYRAPGVFPLVNPIATLHYANRNETWEISKKAWNMHIFCTGRRDPERPTILLSPGAGSSFVSWLPVQLGLNGSHVCSFDRSGYGYSHPGHLPRTIGQMVAEVKQLLDSQNVTRVLWVGHSFGGLEGQFFAYKYPTFVSGLVLMDSPHEYYWYHEGMALGMTMDQISRQQYTTSVLLDIIRHLSVFGVNRLVSSGSDFPEFGLWFKSLYDTKCWNSQYHEFPLQSQNAYILNTSRWEHPSGQILENIPLYVYKAGDNTFNKTCVELNFPQDSPECDRNNKIKTVQLWMIQDVLSRSNASHLVVCQTCNHGFVWNRHEYMIQEITKIYNSINNQI